MKATTYKEVLERLRLVNANNTIRMGTSGMEKLNIAFGQPLKGIPVVHIGGTNGKGSVAFKLAKYFTRLGARTGLFVSPHLSSYRERIQVNGSFISEQDVVEYVPNILDLCARNGIATSYFEATTMFAFLKFKAVQCDIIILEVGCGGRTDATNIVEPHLSIITTVQMDHTKILGQTIEEIAHHKAGIIKPRIPVLIGPGCPVDVMKIAAEQKCAPLYQLSDIHSNSPQCFANADEINEEIVRVGLKILKSCYGSNNSSIFSRISDDNVDCATISMKAPCRFEIFQESIVVQSQSESIVNVRVDVILDIAHNSAAIQNLVTKIRRQYSDRAVHVVFGMCKDKDVPACVDLICDLVQHDSSRVHCVSAGHARATSVASLKNMTRIACNKHWDRDDSDNNSDAVTGSDSTLQSNNSIRDTLRQAINKAAMMSAMNMHSGSVSTASAVVVVCGSAFIMPKCRAELGVIEPRDDDNMDSLDSNSSKIP